MIDNSQMWTLFWPVWLQVEHWPYNISCAGFTYWNNFSNGFLYQSLTIRSRTWLIKRQIKPTLEGVINVTVMITNIQHADHSFSARKWTIFANFIGHHKNDYQYWACLYLFECIFMLILIIAMKYLNYFVKLLVNLILLSGTNFVWRGMKHGWRDQFHGCIYTDNWFLNFILISNIKSTKNYSDCKYDLWLK